MAALLVVIVLSGAWRHLSLSELRDRRAELTGYVREHPVLSLEVYAGAYAILIALSIPGALVMSLSGGYLFGVVAGSAAAVTGETAGAAAMFLMARSSFGELLTRRWGKAGGVVERMKEGFNARAHSTLLMLRLIPGVPFTLVNLLAGISRIRVLPYVLITAVGITPSTVIYAGFGQGLGRAFKKSGALDPHRLLTPAVWLPVVGLGVLAAAPLAWRMWKGRRGPLAAPAGP